MVGVVREPLGAQSRLPYHCPPLAYSLPLTGKCSRQGGQNICGICAGDQVALGSAGAELPRAWGGAELNTIGQAALDSEAGERHDTRNGRRSATTACSAAFVIFEATGGNAEGRSGGDSGEPEPLAPREEISGGHAYYQTGLALFRNCPL